MVPDTQMGAVPRFEWVSNLKVPPTRSGRVALRAMTDEEVARLEPGDIVLRDCGCFWGPEHVEVVSVHTGVSYDRNGQPYGENPVAACRVLTGVVLAFNAEALCYPSFVTPLAATP